MINVEPKHLQRLIDFVNKKNNKEDFSAKVIEIFAQKEKRMDFIYK